MIYPYLFVLVETILNWEKKENKCCGLRTCVELWESKSLNKMEIGAKFTCKLGVRQMCEQMYFVFLSSLKILTSTWEIKRQQQVTIFLL